jgi:tRNA A37 threonylcarbamoyladenosine modification protein TsaB
VQSHSSNKKIVPVLDARRGQVYFAMYKRGFDHGRDLTLLRGEQVGTAEEFLAQLDLQGNEEPPIVITPVPELLADLLSRSETKTNGSVAAQPQLRIEEASPALAPYIGCLGLVRARQGTLTDPLQVDANYVRRSDAELHWKVRTGI